MTAIVVNAAGLALCQKLAVVVAADFVAAVAVVAAAVADVVLGTRRHSEAATCSDLATRSGYWSALASRQTFVVDAVADFVVAVAVAVLGDRRY
jgi:hypothetical protein